FAGGHIKPPTVRAEVDARWIIADRNRQGHSPGFRVNHRDAVAAGVRDEGEAASRAARPPGRAVANIDSGYHGVVDGIDDGHLVVEPVGDIHIAAGDRDALHGTRPPGGRSGGHDGVRPGGNVDHADVVDNAPDVEGTPVYRDGIGLE